MKRTICRSLCVLGLCVGAITSGCDKKDREARTRAVRASQTSTRPERSVSPPPDLQRSYADVQLYEGIMERLRRENLELRQQISQALDTHKQMRERLQLVKEERSQAITGFKEVLDAADQLKEARAQQAQRIQQLEQENQQLRSTITELTQQLEQLIAASEALGAGASQSIDTLPSLSPLGNQRSD